MIGWRRSGNRVVMEKLKGLFFGPPLGRRTRRRNDQPWPIAPVISDRADLGSKEQDYRDYGDREDQCESLTRRRIPNRLSNAAGRLARPYMPVRATEVGLVDPFWR